MTQSTVFLSAILLVSQVAFAEPESKPKQAAAAERDWRVHDIITVEVVDGANSTKQMSQPRRIAVNVVDIRPNGDLVFEGRCEYVYHDQVWEKSITGDVPCKSIGKDRTVSSSKVADLSVKTRYKGDVHDAPAKSKPPQPVKLAAAQASVSPKVEDLRKKLIELNRLQAEVRQLRAETGTQQQIIVRLQMLEVSLTEMRKLGVDVSFFGSGNAKVEDSAGLTAAINNSAAKLPHEPAGKNDALLGFIDWLKENNIANEVSGPTMMMLDGCPASFNVGGEIPIPARGDSKSAVEFQQVGTQVDILPIAQGNNRVRLELRARVSEEDESRPVEINGSHVPAISVRQCDTAVETEFGRPVVLNGFTEQLTRAVEREGGKTEEETVEVAMLFVVTPELIDNPKTATLPQLPPAPK